MSIQDDIFDVGHAADEAGDKKAFDRICKWAFEMEEELDKLRDENSCLRNTIKIVTDTS